VPEMLPFMISIMTEVPMDQLILRLETIHRGLRNSSQKLQRDRHIAESVAGCLRDLHTIAAQRADRTEDAWPRLRLVVGASSPSKRS
jgi:hypothetical protein